MMFVFQKNKSVATGSDASDEELLTLVLLAVRAAGFGVCCQFLFSCICMLTSTSH